MIDDEEDSATLVRWVPPAPRRRATYPHPNTVASPARQVTTRPRRYGDGALALGTVHPRRVAQPPPIPPPRPPRSLPRASTSPAEAVVAAVPAPVPAPVSATAGDRAAWRWLAVLTAIVAVLVVAAVAYAVVGLGLAPR